MDARLVGWARAVKSRHRGKWPPLWLFTDPQRMPDLVRVVSGLPRGLCGVVFRHDGVADRAELARSVWQACRSRRMPMVVAGAPVGFFSSGRHLRAGEACRWPQRCGLRTGSAHGVGELIRNRRNYVDITFLSPAFPTASHPGAPGWGPCRWATMSRPMRARVFALGGIDGFSVRRLPRWVFGAGSIGALLDGPG